MASPNDETVQIGCPTDRCKQFRRLFEIKLGQLAGGRSYRCPNCGATLTFKASEVFAYKHAVAECEKAKVKVEKALGNLVGSASFVPKH